MTHLSSRGFYIVRTLRAALAALDNHPDPYERDVIRQAVAAHVRSSTAADSLESLEERHVTAAMENGR